jgi:inner membrane transporter RhtA
MIGISAPTRVYTGRPDPPGRWQLSRQFPRALGAMPPPGLLLLSILSIQIGAVLAIQLFPAFGPVSIVFMRVCFSAVLLIVASRPSIDRTMRTQAGLLLLFGFVIAAMNLCFYLAIARIPLGIAVTIEFIGPLAVAVGTSRRVLDFIWILLALLGIAILAPGVGGSLDPLGVVFALLAAAGWAGFILVSKRVGKIFKGSSGLALGMIIAALLLLPLGVFSGAAVLIEPLFLLGAFVIAVLSTTIPFALEFEALKRLPPRIYGVLITLEPAVAVMAGAILLNESLGPMTLLAVSCVTAAALGITISERRGSGS